MSQSFYAVLGVDPDADRAAIRRAYRERVKERHPDTSDDPDAPAEFKRLVTARDVLADEDERDRYDRLGHETYVRRHLATDVPPSSEATPDADAAPASSHRSGTAGTRASAGRQSSSPGQSSETTGRAPNEDWQRAAGFYRTETRRDAGRPGRRTRDALRDVLGALGGWLVVHIVFVGTAVGLAWLTYVRTEAVTDLPLPSLAVGLLILGLAVFASAIHLASIAFA